MNSDAANIKSLTPGHQMENFTLIDQLAFIYFLIVCIGYEYLTQHSRWIKKNISTSVQIERRQWMQVMSQRENRLIDMMVLTNLSQGNAFFASTAIIIIGVLAALLGASDQLHHSISKLPFAANTSTDIFSLKIIFLLIIFVVTFFKFAWAFRLSHYTSIMIGATPLANKENKKHQQKSSRYAERVATVAGLAGRHANAGLRTYYYGIAASGWFINPVVFMIATTFVIAVLYRREYFSNAHRVISKQI